jgi:hypothetical protein
MPDFHPYRVTITGLDWPAALGDLTLMGPANHPTASPPMTSPTCAQIAIVLDLLREYVDLQRTTSRDEFDAMSVADRIDLQVETFGPDVTVPTVDEVISSCELRGWSGDEQLLAWGVEGGEIALPASELRIALEAAYDPTMPDWPGMAVVDDGSDDDA